MRIEPGRYRHYKGNEYEVIGMARHSETLEDMVIYRALYGEGDTWVRPASMWNETVVKDGREMKRFEKIGEKYGAALNDIMIVDVPVGARTLKGISVEIPGTGKNVLQIKCRNGLLLCGLFSPEKIDSIDFPACVFSAPEFKDMLANKPLFVSAKARAMGVTEDMTGAEIAEMFEK